MTVAKLVEKCPYCRETIVAGATRCKHCHAELKSVSNSRSIFGSANNFRTGFLSGLLFATIIFILGWLHFHP